MEGVCFDRSIWMVMFVLLDDSCLAEAPLRWGKEGWNPEKVEQIMLANPTQVDDSNR